LRQGVAGEGRNIRSIIHSNPPPLREIVIKSLQTLKIQRNKLGQASFRLRERDRVLLETCAHNLANREKAAIYAGEIIEIRKLIEFLHDVEIAIERVIIRLETIQELSDIVIDLKPALKLLQSVSQQLFEVLPDVSSELTRVKDAIDDTLSSTKITTDESIIPVNRKTPEGEEIIKEVTIALEQEIGKKLPEPPATLKAPEAEPVKLKEMVALTANCSQAIGEETIEGINGESSQRLISYKKAEFREISLKVENQQLEDILLEYAKKSNGEIDIARCSVELKTTSEEVEKALENLGAKGRIKIGSKSGE
jgi:division protein CdvB (Snf7/Vps24/ESCRT-III family)